MKKYLGGIIAFFVGMILMYSLIKSGLLDGLKAYPDSFGIYFLFIVPILYFLVIGIHELGHVAFGYWQDFEFYGLTVGPFSWKTNADGQVKFKWNTKLNLSGGLAMMLPNGGHNLAKRFGWFAAGGPVFSLLLLILLALLAYLLPALSFLELLAYGGSMMSGFIFLVTIIPFRTGGFSSDGMRMLTFAKGGLNAQADLVGLQSLAAIRTGQGYDKLPIESIRELSQNETVLLQQRVSMRYYEYLFELSHQRLEKAASAYAFVMDNISVYPEGMRGPFYLELAIFEAIYLKNLANAEAAIAKETDSPFTEPLGRLLAKAGIADLKEDWITLASLLPDIDQQKQKTLDQNRLPIIESWISNWKSKLS